MTNIEEWRDIEGYEGFYQISNLGRAKSLKFGKERILKPRKERNGYLCVGLYEDGKVKNHKIHRLVANAFLPNISNLSEVNHIDEDKTNNKVDNLEWCDRIYNVRYSQAVAVNQYTLDGKFIRTWDCIIEVQYQLGFNNGNIINCCQGKRKSAGGFIWRYA